jgi:hypothetical protein
VVRVHQARQTPADWRVGGLQAFWRTLALATVGILIASCLGTSHRADPSSRQPDARLVLAVIGDFGCMPGSDCAEAPTAAPEEEEVAALVHSWAPAAILSDGDNSYEDAISLPNIEANMKPYAADLASGRFYSALGDRDWVTGNDSVALSAYGHAAHYSVVLGHGLATLFFADTFPNDPDGATADSLQAREFRADLANSGSVWKITINHEPQYGSGPQDPYAQYRWLSAPGVDLSIAGGHYAEHLIENGINYVIEGEGGETLTEPCTKGCAAGSVWHDGSHYGALRIVLTPTTLLCEFVDTAGQVMHSFEVVRAHGRLVTVENPTAGS